MNDLEFHTLRKCYRHVPRLVSKKLISNWQGIDGDFSYLHYFVVVGIIFTVEEIGHVENFFNIGVVKKFGGVVQMLLGGV